jgi:hypothetical protein
VLTIKVSLIDAQLHTQALVVKFQTYPGKQVQESLSGPALSALGMAEQLDKSHFIVVILNVNPLKQLQVVALFLAKFAFGTIAQFMAHDLAPLNHI